MHKDWLSWLLLATTCGCGVQPKLFVRGFTVLSRRDDAREHVRASDYGLTVQLALMRTQSVQREPMPPLTATEIRDGCELTQLCEWALNAETATLLALGVPP